MYNLRPVHGKEKAPPGPELPAGTDAKFSFNATNYLYNILILKVFLTENGKRKTENGITGAAAASKFLISWALSEKKPAF
jgi:ribosomal protein S18